MAAIDIAGFVAELKDHALEHGFHVHDERHFVETYSLRQAYEVDLHPEAACGGPLDLHLSLDVDPRTLLGFEDYVVEREDDLDSLEDRYHLKLHFIWELPPLSQPPDLLVLATDLAGIGGVALPMSVSAIDSFDEVTDAPGRRLSIVAVVPMSVRDLFNGELELCEMLDRCHDVSEYLVDRAAAWLGEG